MRLTEKQMIRFNQEFGELETILEQLDLMIKMLKPSADFTIRERGLIIDSLDKTIMLSFCKAIEQHKEKADKALEQLRKENPSLYEKIRYVKTARNKAIAHLDSVKKIEKLNSQKGLFGGSPEEAKKSYEEIIEWILKIIGIKDFIRTFNEEHNIGVPEDEIDMVSEYVAFKMIVLSTELQRNLSI